MKIIPFLLCYPLARFLLAIALLLKGAPGGPLPVIRFFLVAAVLLSGPGLALNRFLRPLLPDRLSLRLLAILTSSLSISGFIVWQLYFFNLYTTKAAIAFLVIAALAGLWGLFSLDIEGIICKLRDRWTALPRADKIGLLVLVCFLEIVFESAVGQPFADWDAIVSWDKWALDMSRREGLGGYLMGGYPQFHSAIGSLFYKIVPDLQEPLPTEQLLLHGFHAAYPLLLALSLWCLGRSFRFNGLLAFFLFSSVPEVSAYLANGYADVPLAALLCSTFVLTDAMAKELGERTVFSKADAAIATLFSSLCLFASFSTKGTGALWGVLFAIRLFVLYGRRARLVTLTALAMAAASTYPYLALQKWLTANPEWAETSPFLHSFPLIYAHVTIFTPDLDHLVRLFERAFHSSHFLLTYPLWLIVALAAATGTATLAVRRSRPYAVLALSMLVFWFYTASYDLRNAFPALCVVACAVSFLPSRLGAARGRERISATLRAVLFLALFIPALSNGLLPVFLHAGLRYHLPRPYTDSPDTRHMVFRPEGDLRNILFESPYGRRARHLVSGTQLYRLLAPKGVYGIQLNSYRHPLPNDLVVQNKGMKDPPEPYIPVATLRRCRFYKTLWIYGLPTIPCAFRLATGDQGGRGEERETKGTILVPPNSTVLVDVLPPGETATGTLPAAEIRDGILECTTSPLEGATLSLDDKDEARDPFHGYIRPFHAEDGRTTRILYWMKGTGPAIPRLKITTADRTLTLFSVSLSRATY